MSDPNYEHEFMPNRKGLCKQVFRDGHCCKPEDDIVHVRWANRHTDADICTCAYTCPIHGKQEGK